MRVIYRKEMRHCHACRAETEHDVRVEGTTMLATCRVCLHTRQSEV